MLLCKVLATDLCCSEGHWWKRHGKTISRRRARLGGRDQHSCWPRWWHWSRFHLAVQHSSPNYKAGLVRATSRVQSPGVSSWCTLCTMRGSAEVLQQKKSVCLMLVLASARMALFLPDETKCLSICSYAKDICPAGHLLPVLGGSICNLENELNVHFIWNYKHKQLQKCNLSLLREGQQAIEKHATSPW